MGGKIIAGAVYLLFTLCAYSQPFKITKVIDSNIFQLNNGKLLRLHGIEVPSSKHNDSLYQSVAVQSLKFAESKILNQVIAIDKKNELSPDGIEAVYLSYADNEINKDLAAEYLAYGFGKLAANVDQSKKTYYLAMQSQAKLMHRGIWKKLVLNKDEQEFLRKIIVQYQNKSTVDTALAVDDRIIKIFDTNLFLTESGNIIKMANLDVPSLASPDSAVREYSIEIWKYFKKDLLNEKISFTTLYYDSLSKTSYVKLEKRKFLNTTDYQRWVLASGFARYKINTAINEEDTLYKNISEKTAAKNYGLWRQEFSLPETIFDPNLSLKEFRTVADKYLADKIAAIKPPQINASEIFSRTLLGGVGMGLGGLLGGLGGALVGTAGGARGWDGMAYAGGGILLGCLIGTPAGVYFKAKTVDPNISFGNTLFASLVGTGAGILVGYLTDPSGKNGSGYAAVPLLQLAAAVIYSSALSPSLKMPAVKNYFYEIKNNLIFDERELMIDFNIPVLSVEF